MVPRVDLSSEAQAEASCPDRLEAGARGCCSRARSRRQAGGGRRHRLPHGEATRLPTAEPTLTGDGRSVCPPTASSGCSSPVKPTWDSTTRSPANRGTGEALMPLPDQLTLTLDGAKTTRVKAVDGDGKPIAGVNIGAWSLQKKGHKVFNNWPALNAELWPATGKDGIAVLDWLPEDLCGKGLDWTCTPKASMRSSGSGSGPTGRLNCCTITFLPVETLSGRVTHADGRPAAGVLVSASGQRPRAKWLQPSRPAPTPTAGTRCR